MRLDQFIEIHVQQLGRYAKVSSEIEALDEVNHAMSVTGILQEMLALKGLIVLLVQTYPFA
jgi:hypothetical protein